MSINRTPLPWGTRTFIMGILNITPDSFSGDGLLVQEDVIAVALARARRFAAAGADILDIGGESTRPGALSVTTDEEIERILPVVSAITQSELDVILSVDTSKAEVAEAALRAGANWINDVWALRADPQLAGVAARYNAPLVLMHNRSQPANAEVQQDLGGRYVNMQYDDLMVEIKTELLKSIQSALNAGVPKENIIIDPGIGFGKTVEQNLELVDRLAEIRALGYPILLGPSRKSFIGYTLNLPPDQRMEGTAAAVAVSITRGVDIVRVHDVESMVRVVRMTDAIVRRK